MSSMEPIFILVTCKDNDEARHIGRQLLAQKLVVCANIIPIKSLYRWKGELQEANEVMMALKTIASRWDAVREAIEKLHSYKVPCITKIAVEENDACAAWLREEASRFAKP